MDNLRTPNAVTPTNAPIAARVTTVASVTSSVAVAGATCGAPSQMPAVSSWNHVQTPVGRGTDRTRFVPASDNYIVDDTFRGVSSDVPTIVDPDLNVAALAKQGAPPRGEPR